MVSLGSAATSLRYGGCKIVV